MTDTIRWCFTCGTPEWTDQSFEDTTPSNIKTCLQAKHDVADALVIRAPIDYEAAANKVRELNTKTFAAWEIAEAVVDVAIGKDNE